MPHRGCPARARQEQTTLNNEFSRWLASYAGREKQAAEARKVMRELRGKVRIGRKLTWDERAEHHPA